jgi:hypothetical protein
MMKFKLCSHNTRYCLMEVVTKAGLFMLLQVVISNHVESPVGVAIDWIGRQIYWTDQHRLDRRSFP